MTPKLTDEQIIKALECCSKPTTASDRCSICPKRDEPFGCSIRLSNEALDLINRLQAENEQLNAKLEKWLDKYNDKNIEIVKLKHDIQTAKTEAYKELGKILIDKSENGVISASDIVDIVVEIVGEG